MAFPSSPFFWCARPFRPAGGLVGHRRAHRRSARLSRGASRLEGEPRPPHLSEVADSAAFLGIAAFRPSGFWPLSPGALGPLAKCSGVSRVRNREDGGGPCEPAGGLWARRGAGSHRLSHRARQGRKLGSNKFHKLPDKLPAGRIGALGGPAEPHFEPELWSRRQDSNPRPAVYKTAALPLSYAGPSTNKGTSGAGNDPELPGGSTSDVSSDQDVGRVGRRRCLQRAHHPDRDANVAASGDGPELPGGSTSDISLDQDVGRVGRRWWLQQAHHPGRDPKSAATGDGPELAGGPTSDIRSDRDIAQVGRRWWLQREHHPDRDRNANSREGTRACGGGARPSPARAVGEAPRAGNGCARRSSSTAPCR